MAQCKLSLIREGLVVESPYNRRFVEDLKTAIPRLDRVWNSKKNPLVQGAPVDVWIVNPVHAKRVQRMIESHYHEKVDVPKNSTTQETPEIVNRMFRLRYVGACALRDDGSKSATGAVGDQWVLVFPEQVLREWFEGAGKSSKASGSTLFAILGLPAVTDSLEEIKSAYRRIAKHWHPDVCHEPDATERFQEINEAYTTLSDPKKLRMYIAGLNFSIHKQQSIQSRTRRRIYSVEYRPPFRCGMVKCRGYYKMGRFIVEEIVAWDDIVDEYGRTLSTEFNIHGKSLDQQIIERWK